MAGVDLDELDASDLFDTLQYFYEEDMASGSAEERAAKSRVRSVLFDLIEDEPYKYAIRDSADSDQHDTRTSGRRYIDKSSNVPLDDLPPDVTTSRRPMKPPAQPPTKLTDNPVDPFAGILDSPVDV